MGINQEAVAMAKRFEPVMLFHPAEKHFPIDPKFYLERCALWQSKPHVRNFFPGGPAQEKEDWGEPPPTGTPRLPKVAKSQLFAFADEGTLGKTWFGDSFLGAVGPKPTTEQPPMQDWFLQLAGWEPFVTAPAEVTAKTENNFPTLGDNLYDKALQGSQPWYYAEYFTNQELLTEFGKETPNGLDIFNAVINNIRLSRPRLLVYHFLYALHEEPLRGCEKAGDGDKFSTFAGEWTSVAILIDSSGEPLYIGLTSRNIGSQNNMTVEDSRLSIMIHPWKDVARVGDHPKVFVSKGTHGNYLTPGPHDLIPFTPGDVDLNQGTCAEIEKLDNVISGGEEVIIPGHPGTSSEISIAKIVAATSIFGKLGGALIGFTVGLVWASIEGLANMSTFSGVNLAMKPDRKPKDEAGGPDFGLILRPENLSIPERTSANRLENWPTKMPSSKDNPRFEFIVDRDTQPWWPPRSKSVGYSGRWGPRVTNDPKDRRTGMRCPSFPIAFLEAIARL
jgi:hypothetical protein